MRYPILRQKEVATALWAYRNAIMAEARSEMHIEAFLNETNALPITAQEIEAETEHAIEAVKAAYDALEASLRGTISD